MKKWTGAFQVAALYVGTVIGAGFATGREIVEFFTRFGFYGFLAIFVSGGLFIWMGTKIMTIAVRINAFSYEDLNRALFGEKAAKWMNILMMFMLLGVCAVMLSGAEALFHEQLGLGKGLGTVITLFLSVVVLAVGVKGLFAVNSFVVPLLVFFNLLILAGFFRLEGAFEFFFDKPPEVSAFSSVLSAVLYAAFNLALSQSVLVPVAAEIGDEDVVKLGGWIGGGLLAILLLSSHLIMVTLPDPATHEIPMAEVIRHAASGIYLVYVFVIFGEIFTSIIGNLYGLERQLRVYINISGKWVLAIILVVIYFAGKIGYGKLLGYLYPLFGYISLIFLVLLMFYQRKKKSP